MVNFCSIWKTMQNNNWITLQFLHSLLTSEVSNLIVLF